MRTEKQRRYARLHYEANKPAYLARARASNKLAYEANRLMVQELKSATPCADCGGLFHYSSMDFDHVSGDKVKAVARLLNSTRRQLLAEIAKCEIVCSNCHRFRTWQRIMSP